MEASNFREVVYQVSAMRSRLQALTQHVDSDQGEEELRKLASWALSAAQHLDGFRNVKARRHAMQQLLGYAMVADLLKSASALRLAMERTVAAVLPGHLAGLPPFPPCLSRYCSMQH